MNEELKWEMQGEQLHMSFLKYLVCLDKPIGGRFLENWCKRKNTVFNDWLGFITACNGEESVKDNKNSRPYYK